MNWLIQLFTRRRKIADLNRRYREWPLRREVTAKQIGVTASGR